MKKYKSTDQIGYTCGIYCLIIADCILNGNSFDRDYYYSIIKKCVNQSYTKIGEIFDISTLQKITTHFFSHLNAETYNSTTVKDVKTLLDKYIIIMPVTIGTDKTPHYILLYKNRYGGIIRYNASCKYVFSLSSLLKNNNSIADKYIWPKKLVSPSNFKNKINNFFMWILNKSNLQYRQKYFNDIFNVAREHGIIKVDDIDSVNMNGKFLLISKHV